MLSTRVRFQIREYLFGVDILDCDNDDLIPMIEKFKLYKDKLNALVNALKAQFSAFSRLNESSLLVAECITDIANQSPLSEFTGMKKSVEESSTVPSMTFSDASNNESNKIASYYSIHQSLFIRRKTFGESFVPYVVKYVIEWERVIVDRVSKSLEKAKQLRIEVDHYHEKLKTLTSSTQNSWSSMILGETSDGKDSPEHERLQRNKVKYQNARNAYAQYAQELRLYIEEVTERGWRDLFPVLMKLCLFDTSLASDENKLLSDLLQITTNMSDMAIRYGLEPESRLKDLETMHAKDLSTRVLDFIGDELSDGSSCYLEEGAYEDTFALVFRNDGVFDLTGPPTPEKCDTDLPDIETPKASGRKCFQQDDMHRYQDTFPSSECGNHNDSSHTINETGSHATEKDYVCFPGESIPLARGSKRFERDVMHLDEDMY